MENSLALLALLHQRFHSLLLSLRLEDWGRKLRTQALGAITLDTALQRFIWHHRHHRAQIESLVGRMGWKLDDKVE